MKGNKIQNINPGSPIVNQEKFKNERTKPQNWRDKNDLENNKICFTEQIDPNLEIKISD